MNTCLVIKPFEVISNIGRTFTIPCKCRKNHAESNTDDGSQSIFFIFAWRSRQFRQENEDSSRACRLQFVSRCLLALFATVLVWLSLQTPVCARCLLYWASLPTQGDDEIYLSHVFWRMHVRGLQTMRTPFKVWLFSLYRTN
jgi:hypothetical protein